MRSESWKLVSAKNYHVLFGMPVVERTFVLNVPAGDGRIQTASGVKAALLTSKFFLDTVEPQLLATYHISPASIAFFAVTDMRVIESSGGCCYNGYHDSFTTTSPTGTSTFTTVWGLVASSAPTQLSHVTHEVAELLNDPFYPSKPNIVPSWVHPTANVCDGDLLEDGDPLVKTRFTVNGDTVQDIAFFSWFSRMTPSIGIDGGYDLLGTLKKPAMGC